MEQTNHFLIRTGMTVLCLLMFAIGLKAQNRTVTGKVVDQVGNPLVGVNVIEKGTMNGTMTDLDGLFTITVAPSSLLQFSCISYISEELLPGEGPVNVTLRDDTTQLDDVVVIGYGTARRKDLTGSVIQIRPDNMVADNPKTVQDVLRNAAGLPRNGKTVFIRVSSPKLFPMFLLSRRATSTCRDGSRSCGYICRGTSNQRFQTFSMCSSTLPRHRCWALF